MLTLYELVTPRARVRQLSFKGPCIEGIEKPRILHLAGSSKSYAT
jgi:hypothetical protein